MKLKNKHGNVIKVTNNPTKQRMLKEQGYTEVKEPTKGKKTKDKETTEE